MKSRCLFLCWIIPVLLILALFGFLVFRIDPFFHYHAPLTDRYFYSLNSERNQNDGIFRNFDYDTVLIGSSVVRNFKTTEADRLFDACSIKTPFGGTTYKEINDSLVRLFRHHPEVKTVIRELDMTVTVFLNPEVGRDNLPLYLYNDNLFDDAEYIWNRDIIFGRTLPMIMDRNRPGFQAGITSFDQYQSVHATTGRNGITFDGVIPVGSPGEAVHLSDHEKEILRDNISENIVSVALAHPDTEFHLFFTPNSILWWLQRVEDGTVYKQIEEQACAIESILGHKNIHLYSFNHRFDIITDMNHYFDGIHYGHWVNSLILKWIHDGYSEITADNYMDLLSQELEFYISYDYDSLNRQEDYEYDLYAAALVNQELNDTAPVCLSGNEQFPYASFEIENLDGHRYLVFDAKKVSGFGPPEVKEISDQGNTLSVFFALSDDPDNEWHHCVMELEPTDTAVQITIGNGRTSVYSFRDIMLY